MFSYPFRMFANANLGTQFDYASFTQNLLSSRGVGQSPVLPDINLATGNLILKSTMLKTQEQVGNFELGFVYNAQSTPQWHWNLPQIIASSSTNLVLQENDGSQVSYLWDAAQNAFVSPSGAHAKFLITKNADGSFLKTDPKTGEKTVFDASGHIVSDYDARGFALQYGYDESHTLKTITSAAGVYTVNNNAGAISVSFTNIENSQTTALQTWNFDSQNRLVSTEVPTANNYTINYAYDAKTNFLNCVSQTDGTSLQFSFSENKVSALQLGSTGPSFTFTYLDNQTVLTDALGFTKTASFNADCCLTTFSEQVGDTLDSISTLVTTIAYQDNGDINNITKPDGAQNAFVLDTQGLITQKTNSNGQVTQYDYLEDDSARELTCCAVLQNVLAACLQNICSVVGLETQAQTPTQKLLLNKRELISGNADDATALWAVTRYVYETFIQNGLPCRLLRFVVSPTGCVTEYRYNTQNQLASERTYLKNQYNTTQLSVQTPIQLNDILNWVSMVPPDAISLKTFSENNRGQLTHLHEYTDINPDGVGLDSAAASHNRYDNHTIWGGIGTHLEKTDALVDKAVFATTTKTFDGLQRVLSNQNALNEKKSIVYNDAQQNCVVTEANLRTETSQWNTAGQIISVATAIASSKVTRVKNNTYDAAGRLSCVQDSDGQTTYQLFDSKNRLRFSITPSGRITAYQYHDVARYHAVIHYKNALPIAESKTLPPTFAWIAAQLIKDPTQDVATYESVDLNHRLQFRVDGRGAVTEYRYDNRNNKIATIYYDAQITLDELTALKQGQFTRIPASCDSVESINYDNDNHIIAKQDGEGYVTTYQNNLAAFSIYEKKFATTTAINVSGNIIIPQESADDFGQFVYRDAKNQEILRVDDVLGANYAVQNSYYPTNLPRATIHYANQTPIAPQLESDPASLFPEINTEDHCTFCEYDLLKRLVKQHLPHMRLHEKKYDVMGNVVEESTGDDPARVLSKITTHTIAKQFDDWGQVTALATPLVYEKIQSIQNDPSLNEAQKEAAISLVWTTQAERYTYDAKSGLLLFKTDIIPDGADPTKPAQIYFYYDVDRHTVLMVGALGEATATTPDTIFNKPQSETRYATAVSPDQLSQLTGGFITPAVLALLTADSLHDQTDQYRYDGAGSEESHIDADGFETTTHTNMFGQWDEKNIAVNTTTPTLNITRKFNLRGQLTAETKTADSASIVTKKSYQNLHGQCTAITDGNNATTQLAYEPSGALSSKTDALNNVTTFENDAFGREINRNCAGLNTNTTYTQNNRSVTTAHCDASNAVLAQSRQTQDAFGNVIQTTNANGNDSFAAFNAANQCVSKTDVAGNQETNAFDMRGLLQETTVANSNNSFSTATKRHYNLSRVMDQKTEDSGNLNLETNHTINALSQREQTTTPSNAVRKNIFNKRSLQTERHAVLANGNSVITKRNYNGLKNKTTANASTTNQAHTFLEATVYDGFGRQTGSVADPNGLGLTKNATLDNANRVIATTDPNGNATFLVRDYTGNIRFEINAKGGVTEHRYNAFAKPIFTTQYMTAIDLTQVSAGISIDAVTALIKTTNFDRQIYYFYDGLLNERFRINRAGAVTESRFNLNGDKIASLQYATAISDDPTTLTTALLISKCEAIANRSEERASFSVLDAIGQEIFVINADGVIIQKFYDAKPHVVTREIKYATRVLNPADLAKLSIADIQKQIVTSPNDREQVWVYDGLNRLQFFVSSLGAVTKNDYEGNTNNKITITRFADPVLPNQNYASLVQSLNQLVADKTKDNIETRAYDAAGREILRTNTWGASESFAYDGAGRKSAHTTLSGHTWNYAYDNANRMIGEVSPTTTVYTASINPENVTAVNIASTSSSVQKEIAYDNNSNTISITSAFETSDQHVVNFAYDQLDRKIQDQLPSLPLDNLNNPASLTIRPEKMQSVARTVLFGAHGEKLATLNEAQNPEFYCYNNAGQLVYRVNAAGYVVEYQRDCFGQAVKLIAYATALQNIQGIITQYKEGGI